MTLDKNAVDVMIFRLKDCRQKLLWAKYWLTK
jgi:hypothetical protein